MPGASFKDRDTVWPPMSQALTPAGPGRLLRGHWVACPLNPSAPCLLPQGGLGDSEDPCWPSGVPLPSAPS